ncbi:hypothetical protein RCH33_2367 [Flavobacterium daejeonense]|nr:hypothetical protein RCH33_2367 [Flavobacterium daejeonense]
MNFIEYYKEIEEILPDLKFSANYVSNNETYNYEVKDLKKLRRAINQIEHIPFIQNEIYKLKKTRLFESLSDTDKLTFIQHNTIDEPLKLITFKLNFIQELAQSSKMFGNDDLLLIRIPEINSFDNLTKFSNDLKKGIEIPIIDSKNGEVKILSADEGSIIFYVSVGTTAALTLIGRICWSAAVIRRKKAEANIFEEHARTLKLKNDALENLIEAQNLQLKNILDAEANQIANNIYDLKNPETIERLKLSISTVSELIDRGVQILPASNEEMQKIFPDYKKLDLIESSIRQITSKN